MPGKKKPNASKIAGKLAQLALRRLKTFSEDEQEKRLVNAERLLNRASRG